MHLLQLLSVPVVLDGEADARLNLGKLLLKLPKLRLDLTERYALLFNVAVDF